MANKKTKPIKQGYQIIGDWYVSLELPKKLREGIKREFRLIEKQGVSRGLIKSLAHSFERKSSRDWHLQLHKDAMPGDLAERVENYDNLSYTRKIKTTIEAARIATKKNHNLKTYTHHVVAGSGKDIMPNAFGIIHSYTIGKPRNHFAQTVKDIDKWLADDIPILLNEETRVIEHEGYIRDSWVMTIIDLNNGESRIEPSYVNHDKDEE